MIEIDPRPRHRHPHDPHFHDPHVTAAAATVGPSSLALRKSRRLLFAIDAALTRTIAASARPLIIRSSAIGISKLGNGGLYMILPLLVLMRFGRSGFPAILVALCSATFLHCFYPYVKRRVGRPRPCQTDPTLRSLLDVLDEHSFPSGHTMTLSATLIPIVHVVPGSTLIGIGFIGMMGWARVASAHHYPSDVCAGAVIGGTLSYAASLYFLSPL